MRGATLAVLGLTVGPSSDDSSRTTSAGSRGLARRLGHRECAARKVPAVSGWELDVRFVASETSLSLID